MGINEPRPSWCVICPNKDYCPIRWTDDAWHCAAREVMKEQMEVQE